MKNIRRLKYFLIGAMPLLIIVIPLMYYSIKLQEDLYLNNLMYNERSNLNSEKEVIEAVLYYNIEYTIKLSRLASDILDTHLSEEKLELLENIFYNQFDEKGDCDQLRFIDSTGMERIRINSAPDGKVIVEKDSLQNKALRYYFTAGMKHNDKVFISRADLNVEHSKIEIPFMPMIRITYPVLDKSKKKIGLVVTNIKYDEIFYYVKNPRVESKGEIFILNKDSYWLKGPTEEVEWGFMFDSKKDYKFSNTFPKAWEIIAQNKNGQFINDEGQFTYSILPNLENPLLANLMDKIIPQNPIILVSFIEKSNILSDYSTLNIIIYTGLLILILVSVWIWAGMKIKHIEKEEEILNLNLELENKVIARTIELEKSRENALKNLKQAKINKKQAEEANRVKSVFLSNISHETRTPLNSIFGFTELLVSKNKDPQLNDYIYSIQSSGRKLLNLINEILDTSKLDADEIKLVLSYISINSLADDLMPIFLKKAQSKNLRLEIKISPDLPISIELDKLRLRQAMYNLLDNAIKFTDKGFVKLIIDVNYNNDKTCELIMKIIDTGIGISEDKIEEIFEYFNQQDDSISRNYEGAGLGLSIAKMIIELLGGTIQVSSSVGEGSTFTVIFSGLKFSNKEISEKETPEPQLTTSRIPESKIFFNKSASLDPSVISTVKQNVKPVWDQLQKKRSTKLQKELAEILIKTGQSTKDNDLKTIGEKLKHALQTYNIDEVNVIINDLKNIFK